MKPITKQLQLFLVSEDEQAFTQSLRAIRRKVVFLDGNVWSASEPLVASSIEDCGSRLVYLWDQELVFPLPTITRGDGRLEGPISGVVVQLVRSLVREDVLLSGRVAAGTGGVENALELSMRAFIGDIWNVLREVAPVRLDSVDTSSGVVLHSLVPNYRAGRHAAAWVEGKPERQFKDRSTSNFFAPSLAATT